MQKLNLLLLNQSWFSNELRAIGHRVVVARALPLESEIAIPHRAISIQELLTLLPKDFSVDRILYFDDSRPLSIYGWDSAPVPTLFYSVDSHHHAEWHAILSAVFDKTLMAQKNYISIFKQHANDVSWFPLWSDNYLSESKTRDIPVAFRGNMNETLHPERAKFFQELEKLVAVDAKPGPFAEAYTRAKIVLNQTVRGDLNARVFEAMLCGAMLITPKTENGLDELFVDGKDYVSYPEGDVLAAKEKIEFYLSNEGLRAEIASSGYNKAILHHTSLERAKVLSSLLTSMHITPRSGGLLGLAQTLLFSARLYSKTNPVEIEILLAESVRLILESAKQGSGLSDALETSCIICKQLLEVHVSAERAMGFIEELRTILPESIPAILCHIDLLLKAQQHLTAHTIASTISEHPEELVAGTPGLIKKLLKSSKLLASSTPR